MRRDCEGHKSNLGPLLAQDIVKFRYLPPFAVRIAWSRKRSGSWRDKGPCRGSFKGGLLPRQISGKKSYQLPNCKVEE